MCNINKSTLQEKLLQKLLIIIIMNKILLDYIAEENHATSYVSYFLDVRRKICI